MHAAELQLQQRCTEATGDIDYKIATVKLQPAFALGIVSTAFCIAMLVSLAVCVEVDHKVVQ